CGHSRQAMLRDLLRDEDATVRQIAAQAVVRLGTSTSPEWGATLLAFLSDEDAGVRFIVVEAVNELGASTPAELDAALLDDVDEAVGWIATEAWLRLRGTALSERPDALLLRDEDLTV